MKSSQSDSGPGPGVKKPRGVKKQREGNRPEKRDLSPLSTKSNGRDGKLTKKQRAMKSSQSDLGHAPGVEKQREGPLASPSKAGSGGRAGRQAAELEALGNVSPCLF